VSGRKRLDVLDEKVRRIENRREHDEVAQWLATLSDAQFAELKRRLEAGEPQETVVKDFFT
jgi:hypothetical protein